MDKLKQKLKADAAAIDVEVSPQLRARIDASVQAQSSMPPEMKTEAPGHSLWWSSSLTGLAAAALVIVLISWNREPADIVPPPILATEPSLDDTREAPIFPLTASTAELTEPLEDELRNLQADLEKARDSVAEDLRSSF